MMPIENPANLVAQAEDLLWSMSQTPFCASVNMASGFSLAEAIARNSVEVANARAFFERHLPLFPVIGDYLRQLVEVDHEGYKHPDDAVCLGLLVLTQQVYGSQSPEMKSAAVIAGNLKNSFWTREFLTRWKADSQSGT